MRYRCVKTPSRCFPWCFDVYRTKVNYRIDPNKDMKQKSFEDLLETNYYNIEDVQKIINKDQVLFTTKSVILDYKLKQNYDDKYLFTPLDKTTKVGDIFYWPRTDTHWIVYAQYLTEKSYYKSYIKRADWCVVWKDKDGKVQYQWAYVRGPVETKTKDIVMKSKIYDIPNATLTILMPASLKTSYFQKYSELMINGRKWQVAADVDDISNPGLVELQLIKVAIDYNDDKDNNIVDGLENDQYEFKTLFNNVLYTEIVYTINDLIILYKNGEVINDNLTISSNDHNVRINNNTIQFINENDTNVEFIITYNNNISHTFNVYVLHYDEEQENIVNTYIIGDTLVRNLLTYNYYYNGEYNNQYHWNIIDDNNLVKNINQYNNYIDITFTSKTGNCILELYNNDILLDSIIIQVISAFE